MDNSVEQKIQFIQSLEELKELNKYHFEKLRQYSKDSDYEVRLACSETLGYFSCHESEVILYEMLSDASSIVLSSVCDSLSFATSFETIERLQEVIQQSNSCVQYYAFLTIGDVIKRISGEEKKKILTVLKKQFEKKRSLRVKASIAQALYKNGISDFFVMIIPVLLNHRNYQMRCVALNLIDDLEPPYPEILVSIVEEKYISEPLPMLQQKMRQLIDQCQSGDGSIIE